MINYIIGGTILGIATLITIKGIKKMKNGTCSCEHSCDGCGQSQGKHFK